jgi:spore germination cell wall hydrolase CwlJ-like protein
MDPAMLALADRFTGRSDSLAGRPAVVPTAATAQAAADQPDVIRLQDLSPDAARIWNAHNPATTEHVAAAAPFRLNAKGVLDEARAVDCLTAAVYYEAAMESVDGQRAVAQVVLNRMRHPAFPKTVCGVVFQGSTRTTGCQFSFTCDGSLNRRPSEAGWTRARQVAEAALNGYVMTKVGNATHYHANYVAPYWSPSLLKIGAIGAHIFYRWTGSWGQPPAFSGSYGGNEMAGLQVATLDGIAKTPAELQISGEADAAQAHAEPALEVATPAPDSPKVSEEIAAVSAATATAAATETTTFYKPEQLDWTGRPKARGPSRIAMH